jgi:hypothetical protein
VVGSGIATAPPASPLEKVSLRNYQARKDIAAIE